MPDRTSNDAAPWALLVRAGSSGPPRALSIVQEWALGAGAELTESAPVQLAANGQESGPAPWSDPTGGPERGGRGMPPTGLDGSEVAWERADPKGPLQPGSILIIDDCTLDRENLAAIFALNGIAAPSVAWDLPSLVRAFDGTHPSVVLLNLATRESGLLLRAAMDISPKVRVIVLGASEDNEPEIIACAEAGVAGYHMRTDSLEDLLVLIRMVASGETSCSPEVSAILLRRLSALASQRQPAAKELALTTREAQILRMLELGRSNQDIATQLSIAVHTVKNHVHSLLSKLGVSTRAEAAALSRTIRLHRE
jgi:DNA-binding NarL/FixJ family response regulator